MLDNGKQDAFQAFCSESALGTEFEFYDMGYSAAAGSFLAARDNALRLLILGCGVFALVSVLYFMVLLLRLKPTILSMRRLGVRQRQIAAQLLGVLIGSGAAAVVLGTILGAALFSQISSVLIRQTMPLRFSAVSLLAIGQLLVLCCGGWAGSRRLLYQNLMTQKKTARKGGCKMRTGLWKTIWSANWHRKGTSVLMVLSAGLIVLAVLLLGGLTARQERELEALIRDTKIHCVMTDSRGTGSDNLNMISAYVDNLLGYRHERGCYLDEYVTDV